MTAVEITDNTTDTVTAVAIFATLVKKGLVLGIVISKETEKITVKCHMNPPGKMCCFKRELGNTYTEEEYILLRD